MNNNHKYDKGEKLRIELMPSKDGGRPIGRVDKGLICLLDKQDRTSVRAGEIWECEIVLVREKFLVIKPVKLLVSAAENQTEAVMMAKRAFSRPDRKKLRKGGNNYPFKRGDER